MTRRPKQVRKPPTPPKLRAASSLLSQETMNDLADRATYEGSVRHKDTMSFAGAPDPGLGATHVGAQNESDDCMLCPRKWSWQKAAATDLLRFAIKRGQFDAKTEGAMPQYVWARDPVDRWIVYLARRLSHPPDGYKAYPLTAAEVALLRIDI